MATGRVLLPDGGAGALARHGDLQALSPLHREPAGHWLGPVCRGIGIGHYHAGPLPGRPSRSR